MGLIQIFLILWGVGAGLFLLIGAMWVLDDNEFPDLKRNLARAALLCLVLPLSLTVAVLWAVYAVVINLPKLIRSALGKNP